jgi:hypothetical protein
MKISFFFIIIDYSFRYEILQVYLAATSKSLYVFKYNSQQLFLLENCLDFPNYSSLLKIFIGSNFYRLYIYNQSTKLININTLYYLLIHIQNNYLIILLINKSKYFLLPIHFFSLFIKKILIKFLY